MALASCNLLSRNFVNSLNRPCNYKLCLTAKLSTRFSVKNIRKSPMKYLLAGVPITVGAGYYFYKTSQLESPTPAMPMKYEHTFLTSMPEIQVSRKVNVTDSDYNLKLTLFQYPTCPFCCKVRAFLDYYGIPYDVIEVDPVLRQQTSWTTYKKVPILLAKVDGGYQQLNDSSMIISALKSYLMDSQQDLKALVKYYPIMEIQDKNGKTVPDIMNKYFLMYQKAPKNRSTEAVLEEKKWREWADKSLVHVLSPNVYRTYDEAMQSFTWFSEVGEWDKLFPSWERNIIVYVGAVAMWIIGKNLKKRHKLKDDVRQSLYDECTTWMKQISAKKTKFFGGNTPNLADLAVYGVLSSIEGCLAFKDLLENTNIGKWYFPMKEAVANHEGQKELYH